MKSNTKKRLIAFMLCMVLVLSSATSAFADDNVDGLNAKTGCQAMTLTQEMKNVDDQTIGTVYADIPENAFYLRQTKLRWIFQKLKMRKIFQMRFKAI